MSKRKSLKKTVKSAAVGRVLIGAKKRGKINPGPSKEAVTKIKRFEASNSRAEQRLGMIRLA